jgi:hypothetical protein
MAASTPDREVPFVPELSPRYGQRFDVITDELVEFPNEIDREVAIKDELSRLERGLSADEPEIDRVRYLAILEVLLDLVEIGFELRKNSEFVVVRPNPDRYMDNPDASKAQERRVLQKERMAQFEDRSVREFIRRMETPETGTGGDPSCIAALVASGADLYADLQPLQNLPREEIVDRLSVQVRPYIQVARRGEVCGHTGLDLMDIWRYFRYSWLTPYHTVPGRNINILIRDAARSNHPVMGIASIASPMMNLTVRDEHIGWKIEALEARLEQRVQIHTYEEQLPANERSHPGETRTVRRREPLETVEEWQVRIAKVCKDTRESLSSAMERSLANIRWDDFIADHEDLTEERMLHPDQETFDILTALEEAADAEIKAGADTNPDDLASWSAKSEAALFRKKRARTLKKLLRDKQFFEEHREMSDTEFIETALGEPRGRRAIKTALKEVKKRRAGAGMMNIMVCGAIPPYNHLLGGKLVGMAVAGPEVISEYQRKYEDSISNIASSMKGDSVVKQNEVVFLDTTSLFEVASAQYDRIRVPTPNGRIEYEELGRTRGYGSIQFGPRTRQRLAQVTEFEEGRQVVRGRFGEGVAPRMRKIRRGLENCGLDGRLLKHESRRIVYGIALAKNARAYLRGETDTPEYYWPFDDVAAEQQSIYDHWRERWLSKRIQQDEILERLRRFDREEFLLSSEIEFAQRQLSDFIVGNS